MSTFSFRGSGLPWTRRRKMQAGVGQLLGHRLVGGEHELFDDLMALGVLREVGAGDAAVGVEVDLHLGHRQLERAALEAARAQHHRQLVHPAEQRVDFRRRASSSTRLRIGQVFVDFFVGEPAAALDRALEDVGRHADAFVA